MSLDTFIATYGYAAVLIGTFFEGETILVLGGIAAHLGYLELPWVIATAFCGTVIGDQLYFFLGRYLGANYLRRIPAWQARAVKVHRLLERHAVPLIVGFRFLYGIRTVTSFVIGTTPVRVPVFMGLNVVGASIWACAVGSLGFVFGEGLQLVIGDIKHYELVIMGCVALTGALVWAISNLRLRRRLKAGGSA